jgi:hypothetical protein
MMRLRFRTPVHATMTDAARELIMKPPGESRGTRELVGEFPPGNYVTSNDLSGFKVYRIHTGKVDQQPAIKDGHVEELTRRNRETQDRIASLNKRNAEFYGRKS